jgi:hypothetical protein
LKKLIGSVRFWFYKPENEKTELNQTEPKSKKIRKNRAKLKKPSQNQAKPKKPSQTGLNRFLS